MYDIGNQFVITCFGGSLGATRINEAVIELIDNLLKHRRDIVLFWATGKKEYEKIRGILRKKMLDRLNNVRVFDYVTNMPEIIAISDIVVSRAGAMTISELALAGKCTIIVPSPNVTNNHQYKNAKLLADNDATNLITESELNILTDKVKELLFDEKKREKYEKKIKKFADFDANKKFYLELLKTMEL
jgi:UDP-N-acetylglucosamine--N-acetylmuramyl-(pentapeptide) pyrophosphoryl-undecaprenol N-acetylglucosamine transferase